MAYTFAKYKMSLLDRILGKTSSPPDPTVDWQNSTGIDLVLVPHEGQFGALKFGAPIDDARSLGRPSRCRWIQKDYCELLYAECGFQIDFEAGRLAYIAFFMDRHVAEPDIDGGYKAAVVSLRLAGGRTGQLSKESTRTILESYFGISDLIDAEDDETILSYKIDRFTIEFEIHPDSVTLMRMNIYPTADG